MSCKMQFAIHQITTKLTQTVVIHTNHFVHQETLRSWCLETSIETHRMDRPEQTSNRIKGSQIQECFSIFVSRISRRDRIRRFVIAKIYWYHQFYHEEAAMSFLIDSMELLMNLISLIPLWKNRQYSTSPVGRSSLRTSKQLVEKILFQSEKLIKLNNQFQRQCFLSNLMMTIKFYFIIQFKVIVFCFYRGCITTNRTQLSKMRRLHNNHNGLDVVIP